MEVGDKQKSEEMVKKHPSVGRLVKMDFPTFSLFIHGGWRGEEK